MKLMQLSTKLTQLHRLTGNGLIYEFSFKYHKNKTNRSRGPLKVYFTADDGRVWLIDDYIDTRVIMCLEKEAPSWERK